MKTSHTLSMLVCFVVVSVLSGVGTGFCGAQLTHGPLVAAVTENSAKVWVRTDGATAPTGGVQITYLPDDSNVWLITAKFATSVANDFTVAIPLSNLVPKMGYRYKVLIDDVETPFVLLPNFTTFPLPSEQASFKFGILTDIITLVNAQALSALASDAPDFVLILGDYDHSNPGEKALVLKAARDMHKRVREEDLFSLDLRDKILKRFPVAHVWDDHDYCYNNSDKSSLSAANKELVRKAFDEYWPTHDRPNPTQGLWHSFRYGSLVEVFMLDLRFQRDRNDTVDTCNAPPGTAAKSMLDGGQLGEANQKKWLELGLLNSQATWKFILSTVPWNPSVNKDDAWHVFQCEQQELLAYMAGSNTDNKIITGVIILSGDIHTGGALDKGNHAKCPEMSVPSTNVGFLPNTCNPLIQGGMWGLVAGIHAHGEWVWAGQWDGQRGLAEGQG